MKSVKIVNQKDFTSKLFTEAFFDKFPLEQALFRVYSDFTINGSVNHDYYNSDDEVPEYITWEKFRPICFSIIKGNHKPVFFKIIFHMNSDFISDFEKKSGLSISDYNFPSLYLNIKYENSNLTATTGISIKTFVPYKDLENAFDAYICQFLKTSSIEYEEL